MKKQRYLFVAAGLSTLTGIAGSLLFPSLISAKPVTAENRICGEQTTYMIRRLDGEQRDDFCQLFRDKVLLVVNTASRCAFTSQYEGLEKLYQTYADKGLVVVGFPSNDFGNQEPGSEGTIKQFCKMTYGVEFPMYEKTRVKGEDATPLYQALLQASGEPPRWNFHKYLIDRDGMLVGSYGSAVGPQDKRLTRHIERLL